MKNLYVFILISAIISILSFTGNSNAQFDDPRFDRVPDQLQNSGSFFNSVSTIETIDNYDNFYIGIDFAEVHVAMDPGDPLKYAAAWNNLSASIGARGYATSDGGITWFSNQPVWGTTVRGDPCLAYDSLGRVYFENMYGSSILGTKIASSDDNGLTWPSVVFGNTGVDKNWMAADQTGGPYANQVYTVMTPGNFKRSTDRGLSFVQTATLSPQTLPGMMVCVGPNGNVQGGSVYVVTNSGNSFGSTYTFFRSTDGGLTFTNMSSQAFANFVGSNVGGRNSVQNMRTRPYPFICADNSYGPNRGRLYVVYASNTPVGDGNKPDIFCRYSTDGGTTWSAETLINDDPNSANNNQWMPAPWCDKETGRLYVQWMDTRDCPTSDSCYIYGSYSTDGGVTFAANQKISNKLFRINCTQCNGGVPAYLGDYNSIVSNSKTSMSVWTDFRNNNFANYAGYLPDYAMRVNPPAVSINNSNTTAFMTAVPSVKLYDDVTTFSALITPIPAAGAFTVEFPDGNTLSSYPDSLQVRIYAASGTTSGAYTVTVKAAGSNGTPVHVRTVTLTVGTVGISEITEIPSEYELYQNFPNPFNPETRISYYLKAKSKVKLTVFDLMGRVVASINKGEQEQGSHFVNFSATGSGKSLSSGVYYYRLDTEFFSDTKKMLLIK